VAAKGISMTAPCRGGVSFQAAARCAVFWYGVLEPGRSSVRMRRTWMRGAGQSCALSKWRALLDGGNAMAYLKELKVTFTRKRVDDDLLDKPVESPEQVYALFKDMQNETKEKVVVLHLNPQLEILSYEIAAIGTGTQTLMDPVELYRNAMLARAHSLIVVHNHPSGTCRASDADIEIAARLVDVGTLLGMPLQDFIIIGDGGFASFREQGRF
jgi:DNA repair protein RadC